MKAVVHDRYGPPNVLRVSDIEQPVPTDDAVLVRVVASTVNRTDCGWRKASPFFTRFFTGIRRPRRPVLGSEFAGTVEAVGANVSRFQVGDRVFGISGFGGNAEFVSRRETSPIATMPDGLSFAEAAAACDGAIIANSCLRRAGDLNGRSIVIYGATGAIGTAAVQLAKHLGANVVAVGNTKNLELLKSLGADHVVDYTTDDFTTGGEKYDVVFDAVGKHSFRRSRGSLKRGGIFLETDLGFMWHVPLFALWTRLTSKLGGRRVTLPVPDYSQAAVLEIKELVEAGAFRPVIDRSYPIEQVVDATTYVETKQKTGNVVLAIAAGVAE